MNNISENKHDLLSSVEAPTKSVPVLLPMPAERAYSYGVPEGMTLEPGDVVQVPLGPRKVAAIVWDGDTDKVDPKKLRSVLHKFDCPPIRPELRKLVDWVAAYTVSPPGMVAKMLLRASGALEPEAAIEGYRYEGGDLELLPIRMTQPRLRVLELAGDGMAWTRSGFAHAAGVSSSVVKGLIEGGVFEQVMIPPPPVVAEPDADFTTQEFVGPQQNAANSLTASTKLGQFSCTLLDGITGSGKTEVYFEAVAEALCQNRQVLILLPEISLTSAFLERFEKRFGAPPAEWHSGLSPSKRDKVWRQIATGQVRAVVGARSALFLPFKELGLIVVDEEHDTAYKQEDRVFYNARDMAVVRGSLSDCPVVLASATPSIETRVNADQGRYKKIVLAERFADATLPDLHTIDMRKNPPERGCFISPILNAAMAKTLERGEQSLLFLNRRGYAPLTLCRVCGHRFQCEDCSSWLVEHRFRGQLQCHHCGHHEAKPEACPECGTLDHLVACGPGVERLGEEVAATFPDARVIILSSDMLGGVARLRLELDAIAKGEADIVIGTQLVAKGHNFPMMTCVGVVDADLGLANGDPRAAERTFQLLSQVTGRAGRAGGKSAGYLQSYLPEHPVIQAIVAGDKEAFYEREVDGRRAAGLPPYGRLASIIISAGSRPEAESHARALRGSSLAAEGVSVFGPAEAPMHLVRGRYRFRLLVRSPKQFDLSAYLAAWMKVAPKQRGSVRVQIDVDPQSFL